LKWHIKFVTSSVHFPLASILTQRLPSRYVSHFYPRAIQFWNHMGSILGLPYKTAQIRWYQWDCSKLCFSRSFSLNLGWTRSFLCSNATVSRKSLAFHSVSKG
uniref:Uncharacterized protein n=1 Tax=Gallus gallus TaxID=9031 RepID=A0A8V0ZHJ6_CHICK